MGLLKHFTLPILAAANAYFGIRVYFVNRELLPEMAGWPIGTQNNNGVPLTNVESHLIGIVGIAQLLLLVNTLAAIGRENAHYRGMATLLQCLFYTLDSLDAYWTDLPLGPLPYFAAFAGVSLIIHCFEPGIFAKDKTATKSKKK